MNGLPAPITTGLQTLREQLRNRTQLHAALDELESHLGLLRSNEEALQRQLQREQAMANDWQEFFLRCPNPLCISDLQGYFHKVNPALAKVLGYRCAALVGKKFIDLVHPEDQPMTFKEMKKLRDGRDTINFENRYRCRNGKYRWLNWTCPAPLSGSELIYSVARDVTDAKRNTEEILFLAQHDSLTGLRNRASFRQELLYACERAKRSSHYDVALLFIDLNDFKAINDTHGHSAGDLVLSIVAERLRQASRSGDVVARLGGDEFTILLQGANIAALDTLVLRIQQNLQPAIDLRGGHTVTVTASIGVACWHALKTDNADELLDAADKMMYAIKQQHRATLAATKPPRQVRTSPRAT